MENNGNNKLDAFLNDSKNHIYLNNFDKTDPYFNDKDIQTCNYQNMYGRGYVPCQYGVFEDKTVGKVFGKDNALATPATGQLTNNCFIPQLDPRPFYRIGNAYRGENFSNPIAYSFEYNN